MTHWTQHVFVDSPDHVRPALESRAESADEDVAAILDLLHREFDHDPDSVLEIACGVGGHVVAFARAGLAVDAFDISPAYVRRARQRIDEAGVEARVFRADMREMPVEGSYDLATMLWNSFGYFEDETNAAVLESIASALAPGGVLLFEVTCRDFLVDNHDPANVIRENDRVIAETFSYEVPTSRYEIERDLFEREDGELRHQGAATWRVRTYSPPEIEMILQNAGFEQVVVHANYDGDPPSMDSHELVVAARVP